MDKNRLLIVEDDSDTANMLKFYFKSQGYEVCVASCGSEALEICQKASPDLVILDIRLPDIDGYEVFHRLRAQARTSETPIIFLSRKKERKDKISGLEMGAVDYIIKPFDLKELHLRVRNALRRASFHSLVSPITGLSGEELCSEKIASLLKKPVQDWAILAIYLENLLSFRENYGFVASFDMLRAVGLLIQQVMEELGRGEDFIGHPQEDIFIIITYPDQAKSLKKTLIPRLEEKISYFYPVRDREAAKDRKIPAIQIATGLVTGESAHFTDLAQIFQALSFSKGFSHQPS